MAGFGKKQDEDEKVKIPKVEEEKTPSEAAPAPTPEPQPAAEPKPAAPAPAKTPQEQQADAKVKTLEAARKANEQGFRRTVQEHAKTVETTIEEPGEMVLPENMEKYRETLEKNNAAGMMGNGTTFGYAVNRIGVDVESIKDEQQLAYFATTLHSDKDKRAVMSAWAEHNGLDAQEVIFHGEELLGNRLFTEPQTAQGGLNAIGLVDMNGKKIDMRSADFSSIVHAAKSIPDKTIRKQAFAYIEDLTKVRGGRFYGQSLDGVDQSFVDTLDFPQESYDDFVDGLGFYGAQGREEENLRRYMAAYDSIHGEGSLLNGAQKKWYQQALDDTFRSKTGAQAAPDAEMARAALEQLDAARDAQNTREKAQAEEENEPGLFESIGDTVRQLWNRMTGGEEEKTAGIPGARLVASTSPILPALERKEPEDVTAAAEEIAATGEVQGPAYQAQTEQAPQTPTKVDLTADIASALEYSHTGRAEELDDATLAALDGLYKNADSGVRAILRMADPEFYEAYATGNDAPENMWQRRTGDMLGSKMEKYVRRIYGEDFPKELYGDAVMALVGVVEAANADGTFTEDDRIAWQGSRVAWYVDKNPDALAPVEAVFAQIEGMRADAEANDAAILAERDAELERDRQAVAIGQASEIQYQNVLRHAPQMDNAMGMRDPTYAEMYDQISLMFWDAAGNWGDDSPAFMDTYVYKTMKARGVQDLDSGESEYEMLIYGTMENLLLDDMRVAASLGKSLGEYYNGRGGMTAEDICERASAEIVRMGGEISEEEVAAVQQTVADEAEKAGLGRLKTVEVGGKLGHETVKGGRYESFLMVAAATDIPRDVARVSMDFNQMYGFFGPTAYKKEMYAYAQSGKLPQELSEHIIGYLDEGGDPYQLGIHPGDNGWAVDGYAKAQERIAAYQKMIEAEATEGEKKAAQYISGVVQSGELMVETTGMSLLLAAFGPVGSYAALRTVYGSANQGKSMSDFMASGYTLRESLALSGAQAAGEAMANMTTLGHLTDSLKGYSALLSKGLSSVGGVGNPKVVGAFMTGMKSFFSEIAEETIKDPLLEGVYGDAAVGAVKSAIDDGKIDPLKNIVAGVNDALTGLPETVNQMISEAPQTIMATIPFALLGAGGDVIRNSQSAKAAQAFIENPTAQTAKAVEAAIAADAQDGRFIDAMRKAQRDAEVETETAGNLLLDPDPALYEKAQKTREQADSHKAQMDASQTRIEEGWAAYDEGEKNGDVNEQLAALETIAKAEQGLAEHTREYEQKNLEAKSAKRELVGEARSRAVADVNARHARQKAELTAELAARETPEKKMEALEMELEEIGAAFISADDAGDEAQIAELEARQNELLAQMEAVSGEMQAQQDAQDAEAEAALAQTYEKDADREEKAALEPVYRDLRMRPVYVDKQQAAEIKSMTGLTIPQFNRKYGMNLTTDKTKAGKNSLDGSFFADLAEQAPGYIEADTAHPEEALVRLAERKKELAQVQAAMGDTSAQAYLTGVTLGTGDPVKQRIASELKKNTGVDLVTASLENGLRGWYDRKNNQLVISNKLGAGETERVVVIHELTHYIEKSPGYEAYKNAVLEAAYEGGEEYRAQMLERDREDLKEQYAAHGVTLSEADVEAELVAAATERVIGGDEMFFESLIAGGKTSLLRRVYMKVRNFLARRKAKKASKEMLAQYDAMAKARDLMEKALKNAPRGAQADGETQYAVSGETADDAWYDYSKPFAQQVDDWINGDIRAGDTLIMGGTPKVLQDIGFNNLPMTFDQKHLREMLRTYKNEDHHIDLDVIKRLPDLVADPVAIIEADVENRDDSVLIILGEKNENADGKEIVGAINVRNGGQQNGKSINATRLITTHSRGDLEALVKDAVAKEQNGDIGVYYVNKKALPNSSQNNHKELLLLEPDGFVHSIHDAKSPVNARRIKQEDSEQFSRYIKGSVIVNPDGTPKVMYRGGDEDIEIFDRKKSSYSNLYGRGFYFTESKEQASVYGEARPYYLAVKHPLSATSKTKAIKESQLRAFLEEVAENEDYGLENYGYGATVDSVMQSLKGKNDFDVLQDINATCIGDLVAAVELFNEVNGTNYDGIITPTETVVFDSTQIKSADKNIGLFDPKNPNVKYSVGTRMFGNNSAQRADFISDEVKRLVQDTQYERDTNREQVKRATERMDELGGSDAAAALLLGKDGMFSADDNALAFVTMAEATRNGDNTTAALLAMRMNEKAGEQGSALQSLQIAGKLTAAGAMAETIRKADRANAAHGVPEGSFPIGEGAPKIGGTETSEDGSTTAKTPEAVEQVYRTADEVNAALDKLPGDISYDNPWALPLSDRQMELVRQYKLSGVKLPGAAYNVATLKQRMLAAIIAAGPEMVGDGQKALCQQLEAMKRGHAVVTTADLNYTAGQMAEFRLREGSEATTPQTKEGRMALGRVYQAQDNVTQEGFFSKWSALRFMNMLSAPATSVRNVTSNVLASGLENTATAIASVVDVGIGKKTGNRTTTLAGKSEKRAGQKAFAAEAAQTFTDYFVTHVDTGHGRKYAAGGQGRVFESEFLEGCRNLVDFAMQIGDRPFYERTYAQELAIVKRLGMKATEMQDGKLVSRPMTETEMHEEATARALKRVFQEDNQIVDALNSFKAKSPEADLFISTLMPFIKTPTNIAMRAIEYSPVGLGITLGRRMMHGIDSGKKQSISQRDYVMGIGRGLTGSALIAAGYALAACGTIGFGRGEEENDRRSGVLSALGEPYSMYIRIGDTKHEIDWALPMSSAIAMGAELFKALEDGEGLADAAGSALINGVGEQIMSTPMLSAMNDIFRGYDDTENTVMRLAKTGVSSLINQTFSPAVIRAIAKATDPYMRDTGSSSGVWAMLNQNLIQYWPGMRQMLPIKTDMTGDKQLQSGYWNPKGEHGSMMMQMLDSFFTPTATIGEKNDAELMELLDLSYRTDESAFLPTDLISKNKYELKLNQKYAKALGYAESAITMAMTDDEKRAANAAFGNLLFNGSGNIQYLDRYGMPVTFPGLRAVMNDEARYEKQEKLWSAMTDEERVNLVTAMRDEAKGLIAMDVARRKKGDGEL